MPDLLMHFHGTTRFVCGFKFPFSVSGLARSPRIHTAALVTPLEVELVVEERGDCSPLWIVELELEYRLKVGLILDDSNSRIMLACLPAR